MSQDLATSSVNTSVRFSPEWMVSFGLIDETESDHKVTIGHVLCTRTLIGGGSGIVSMMHDGIKPLHDSLDGPIFLQVSSIQDSVITKFNNRLIIIRGRIIDKSHSSITVTVSMETNNGTKNFSLVKPWKKRIIGPGSIMRMWDRCII